jgi:amino acid adenylation domain-containing protein
VTAHLSARRFAALAAAAPGKPCVEDPAGTVSRGQLMDRVTAIAKALTAAAGSSRLIGVLSERDANLVAAMLAVHQAGNAYLPLDPAHPDQRLADTVADAAPALVITTAALAGRLSPDIPVLLIDDLSVRGDVAAGGNAEGLAWVMYTSGSTGRPKGVAVPASAMSQHFTVLDAELAGDQDQVWLAASSVVFDSSVTEILWAVTSGHLVCIGDNTPLGLLESPLVTGTRDGRRVTHMQGAASMARILAADPDACAGVRGLKVLMLGGEAYPVDLVGRLTGPRLLNVYGPTETTVWVARSEVTADSPLPVTIGAAAPGTGLRVLDDLLQPAVEGMLYISGRQLAAGYWQRPGLTATAFLPDPFAGDGSRMYRTGDQARVYDHGIVVKGRADGMVKIRGNRVELGEVELAVRDVPGIRDAVVLVDQGPVLVCVYDGDPDAADAARRQLAVRLPAYMRPARFVMRSPLPRNGAGKLDRRAVARELRLSSPEPADVSECWPSKDALIVRNQRLEDALWPADLPVPGGWREVFGPAPKDECLKWLEE